MVARPSILTLARQPGTLTKPQLAAFELYAKGMSERGIALALGISRSAVRSRLEEAKRKLAAALQSTEAA